MIEVNVIAAIGCDQDELAEPGYGDIHALPGASSGEHAALKQRDSTGLDLEGDRPEASDFGVHTDIGLERTANAAQIVRDLRIRMSTDSFRVSHPIQTHRVARDAGVLLNRAIAGSCGCPVQVAEIIVAVG